MVYTSSTKSWEDITPSPNRKEDSNRNRRHVEHALCFFLLKPGHYRLLQRLWYSQQEASRLHQDSEVQSSVTSNIENLEIFWIVLGRPSKIFFGLFTELARSVCLGRLDTTLECWPKGASLVRVCRESQPGRQ